MDGFDLFGEADEIDTQPGQTIIPRSSCQPHFTLCRGIWPRGDESDEVNQCKWAVGLRDHSQREVPQRVLELRASRGVYGKACAKALQQAHQRMCHCIDANANANGSIRQTARTCLDFCDAQLQEGDWDAECWQQANFLALCYRLASCLYEVGDDLSCTADLAEAIGFATVQLFNMCITLLVSPTAAQHDWLKWMPMMLQHAEATVGAACPRLGATVCDTDWQLPAELAGAPVPDMLGGKRTPEAHCDAMTNVIFFDKHLQKGAPVVIQGHLSAAKWEALQYFTDLRRLHQDFGNCLVPVNLGSPLLGHRGVAHWPLRRLIEEHLLPSNKTHGHGVPEGGKIDVENLVEVAYMSQHHLLHQAEELQSLLAIPPYMLGRDLLPANVWIGTRGTVTTLHSDPSDGLLCQVAGWKYYRLYALDQTDKLYATLLRGRSTNSHGTSPVRVEGPQEPLDAFPAFADAEYVEGILAPGDMLFIPKSVWHYVRSLTTSVSISFWFG